MYLDVGSRPNAAVNSMISAMVLMHKHNWTYEQLFSNLQFNLLTRLSLGLAGLQSMPFCMATLFNFQNRLSTHYAQSGEDIIESIFDGLTAQQLKALGLNTSIQRCNSFMAESNIRDYTRVQLLVQVVVRLLGADRQTIEEQTAGQWNQIVDPKPDRDRIAQLVAELAQTKPPTSTSTTTTKAPPPLTIQFLQSHIHP